MTQVWFRNPDNYIKELVETGQAYVAWDRGYLEKRRIDADKHAQLYFNSGQPYRALLIGTQGTAELRNDFTLEKPAAVYPTWAYGDDLALLEEMLENPAGQDMIACNDKSVSADERPVWGQEHRVIITDLPSVTTGPGRKMMTVLKTLQEDYPDAIVHIHGLYSMRVCFGMGFGAADFEPRSTAQKGKVYLANGKEIKFEKAVESPQWVTQLGFKPVDLAVPRVRCMFNIKSALWAGEHYNDIFNFKAKRNKTVPIDITTPREEYKPPTDNRTFTKNLLAPSEGDKFHCNTCSLQNECKQYRDGAVCTLSDAEPKELATYFGTRDSSMIIDGLGQLMEVNTRRLKRSIDQEEIFGDVSPEVTKMLGQVFDQGVKLAKLIDPNLRAGAKVQVNVGQGGQAQVVMDPKRMAAEAIRALEAQGIPRDKITPQMVAGLLEGMADPSKTERAVQGEVVAYKDERSA